MIKEIIEQACLTQAQKDLHRKRSGKFKPSSFGHCYRAQFYERSGVVKEETPDVKSILRMTTGKLLHSFLQTILSSNLLSMVEYKLETDNISAYVDLVAENSVVEFKTTSCKSFKKLEKYQSIDELIEHKKDNVLQVLYYAKHLNRNKAYLVYLDTCSFNMLEFEIDVAQYESVLTEEIDILDQIWEKQELPPKSCRLYHGYEYKFCGFAKKCEEDELKKGDF